MELMARQDKIEDYIWARLGQSVARSLTEEEQTEAPSIYDRQITRIDKLLERLDEIEKQPTPESPNQPPIDKKTLSSGGKQTSPGTQLQSLPTQAETTAELKRRLAKELYKAELDLSGGLKIAGKACDCLDAKHTLLLEAVAEELISQDPANSVYSNIVQWVKNNQPKVTIEAIQSRRYDKEYPQMAAQFKNFRKRVMGTAAFSAMEESAPAITLEEAKKIAAAEAEKEVETRWESQEKMQGK